MSGFFYFNMPILVGLFCLLMPDVSAFLIEDDLLASLVKRFESEASQRSTEEIHIPEDELTEALRIGRKYVDQWEKLENQISKEVRKTEENHGTTNVGEKNMNYPCRHASKPRDPEVAAESKEAAVYLVARKYLSDKLGIPAEKIGDFGQTTNFRNGADDRQTCDATSKFRNIDGTCNNLVVPSFGKSGSIFSRLIVNSNEGYGDGIGAIRTSKLTKNPLPSPRSISTAVLVNDSVPNPAVTLLAMQWGQFLDHDLTLTPTFKNNGQRIRVLLNG
ncbi:chorion peroxidase-like [Daphnia pulex]|uniref:chorion peroxidase-like n=1 Tax=Daphnia pulex TaxID=6669 RepID=UPI001EDDF311|nr:chorion peroxidase-like [Daphnia pulex]